MAHVEGDPPGDDAPSLRARLWSRARDPTLLAGPPVAVALCVSRRAGLVAPLPYWLIVTLVLGAQAVSIVLAALWTGRVRGWHLTAYVGGLMGLIGAVAYSTGWGPVLSLGFIFGAAFALHLSGSAATRPALVWTVLYMALGELAIALGIAPSLVRKPLVHGLAGLGLLGVLLTIMLLGRSVAARRRSRTSSVTPRAASRRSCATCRTSSSWSTAGARPGT